MKNSLLINLKSLCILLILIIPGFESYSQSNWTHLNPKPMGFTMLDASFADANNGWAVGEQGCIAKTTDGGTSWTYKSLPPYTGNGLTNFRPLLTQVQFLNANTGYVTGYNGTFLKTVDGGTTWNYMNGPLGPVSSTAKVIYNLYFFDANTGWIIGDAINASSAYIYKTTDGGVTWAAATNVPILNNAFLGIDFVNPSTGYICGSNGKVIKTTDGGTTWTNISLTATNYTVVGGGVTTPKNQTYACVVALDSNTAIISSLNNGCILRTTNAGTSWYASGNQGFGIPQMATWQMATSGPNKDTIIVAGGQAHMAKSTDRGLTWTTQQHYTSSTNSYNQYYAPVVVPGGTQKYILLGASGIINTSTDGGSNWTNQYASIGTYNGTGSSDAKTLQDVSYIDANNGMAAGANGTLVTTADGGITWVDRSIAAMNNVSGTQDFITGVRCPSLTASYIVSGQGVIDKSTDFGVNWVTQLDLGGNNGFMGMDFIDNNTGWACTYTGTVYKTSDGTTWAALPSFTSTQMNALKFLDANNGWVAGNSGKIFHTTNGGTSWTPQTSGITTSLTSIQFIDANNGFACGNSGKVLVTTDGGVTWNQKNTTYTGTLNKVFFIDNLRGIVLASGGACYTTPDGGISWNPLYAPTGDVLNSAVIPSGTSKIIVAGGSLFGVHGDILSLDFSQCAVTVITQPSNTSVCAGTTANFNVTTTGSLFGTFQWQVSTNNGVTFSNIAGATSSSYSFVPTGIETGYQYRCLITNSCGSPTTTTSTAGILTFNTLPALTLQPVNATSCLGTPATFTVTATGTGITYQWQVSTNGGTSFFNISTGAIYSGTSTNTLTVISVVATQNNYQFRCVVSGVCAPAVNSAAALLTIPVLITTQPVNSTLCPGSTANFSVTAAGPGLTYQWKLSTDAGVTYNNISNGGIYSGAVTNTLTITPVTGSLNSYKYLCIVSGSTCNVSSAAVTLNVNVVPSIVTQPVATTTICTSQNFSLSVTALGTAATYQWQLSSDGGTTFANVANGSVYTGATTGSLSITGVLATMNNYQYRCVVSGTCAPAATSAVSSLAVLLPVSITSQPLNSAVCENNIANFSVTATGTITAYQWQVSTVAAPAFTNIPGANTNLLNLTTSYAMNGNIYRCIITTSCSGNITSGTALLTVNQNPVITLATNPVSNLIPGNISTISITNVSPAAAVTYVWLKNGVVIPGATGSSVKVGIDDFGTYAVTVTDINGCTATSNNVTIGQAGSQKLFIYPNPSSGRFQVRLYNAPAAYSSYILNIYDSKGARVYSQTYPLSSSYTKMDVDLSNVSSGIYQVVVIDLQGKQLATGKVMIY